LIINLLCVAVERRETDLEWLLPDRWVASHPEHVLQHRLEESRRKTARQKEARQARRAVAGREV
jgi:hypothetical protein